MAVKILDDLDNIGFELAEFIEKRGHYALPLPSSLPVARALGAGTAARNKQEGKILCL